MSKEIKTKITIKDIKILDKAADVSTHAKDTFIRSKDTAEQTQKSGYNSPVDYATEKISGGVELAAGASVQKTAHHFKNPQKNVAESVNKAKEHFQGVKRQLPKERKRLAEQTKKTAQKTKENSNSLYKTAEKAKSKAHDAKKAVTDAKRTLQQTRQGGQQTVRSAKQSIKTGKQTGKNIKTSSKTLKETGKATIKTVKQSVKTAESSAKTAVKTAQQTAKAAQRTAQASVKAAKIAAKAAKVAAKSVAAAVKATIAAVKSLVAIIAAGGWIAVIIIIIICLVGMIAGSCYGIFFSGEDALGSSGQTLTNVISELNNEFQTNIRTIEESNPHDRKKIISADGTTAILWNQVLSIYAVKVTSDSKNATEVVTVDDTKIDIFRSIFNDMNSLSYEVKTELKEQIVTSTDEYGNPIESIETVEEKILVITLNQKSANEMATIYSFNEEQKKQLNELLSDEYGDMWSGISA